MSEKRRGLGRGIGALIPSAPTESAPEQASAGPSAATATVARPVDVFFPTSGSAGSAEEAPPAGDGSEQTSSSRSSSRSAARSLMEPGKKRTRSKAAKPATTKSRPAETTADEADLVAPPEGHQADGATPETARKPEMHLVQPEPQQTEPGTVKGDELVPVPGATFAELPVERIVPNTRQPRQVFDEEELDELAASIREVGVLQPVVVRPLPEATEDGAAYELIMGERRWRASKLAGSETVPAIVRSTSDADLLRDALLENLHRSNLNPLEEAAAYNQLLEDFGCTHDELATRIARSRPQISNTLRLLKLPPLVQRRVAAGVLSAGHARALLGLSDPAAMERLAQKIVAEGLSVRATEEIVALGDEPVAPEMRRRPRTNAHTEDLNRLATRLSDKLDTRVKVNLGQRKGRIAIEFASVEDLNRILDALAPDVEHVEAQGE